MINTTVISNETGNSSNMDQNYFVIIAIGIGSLIVLICCCCITLFCYWRRNRIKEYMVDIDTATNAITTERMTAMPFAINNVIEDDDDCFDDDDDLYAANNHEGVSETIRYLETIGYSKSGIKDINHFRKSIKDKIMPSIGSITYNGLLNEYYFDIIPKKDIEFKENYNDDDVDGDSSNLFNPTYCYAKTYKLEFGNILDDESIHSNSSQLYANKCDDDDDDEMKIDELKETVDDDNEYYITVGLDSNIKQNEYKRKCLNLVIVLNNDITMDDCFSNIDSDDDVNNTKSKIKIACWCIIGLLKHLTSKDRFALITTTNAANNINIIQNLIYMNDINVEELKQKILAINATSKTDLNYGYNSAFSLYCDLFKSDEYNEYNNKEYENRIIVLSDSAPNTELLSFISIVSNANNKDIINQYPTPQMQIDQVQQEIMDQYPPPNQNNMDLADIIMDVENHRGNICSNKTNIHYYPPPIPIANIEHEKMAVDVNKSVHSYPTPIQVVENKMDAYGNNDNHINDIHNSANNGNHNDGMQQNIEDVSAEMDFALVQSWLTSIVCLPQYYEAFISNGYESMEQIYTIKNKTELNRIGIGLKGHQTKIMTDISRGKTDQDGHKTEIIANYNDSQYINLPQQQNSHFYPTPMPVVQDKNDNGNHSDNDNFTSVQSWLTSIVCLPEYHEAFIINGYESMEHIYTIKSISELNRIGITLKEHQTQILAHINIANHNDQCINYYPPPVQTLDIDINNQSQHNYPTPMQAVENNKTEDIEQIVYKHPDKDQYPTDTIYTTIIGVGLEMDKFVVDKLSEIRGCNYYSVKTAEDFIERMDEEFEYMVNPLVFDICLKLLCEGDSCYIDKIYGTNTEKEKNIMENGEIIRINTLFPSQKSETKGGIKGGVELIRLKRKNHDIDINAIIEVTFEDRDNIKYKNEKFLTFKNNKENKDNYYDNNGIRKAILLCKYVEILMDWIKYENDNDNIYNNKLMVSQKYKNIFYNFSIHLRTEMQFCDDKTLQKELDLLTQLMQHS